MIFFTDGDLPETKIAKTKEGLLTLMKQTRHIKKYFDKDIDLCIKKIYIVAANSSCLETIYGNSWLAIGDSATSFDPLSSQGISMAIYTGIEVAYATYHFLKRKNECIRRIFQQSS